MKNTKLHTMKYLSNVTRWFSAGFVVGASAFAIWGMKVGVLEDDVRLRFAFILGAPSVIFLGMLPGLWLQFSEGISKMKLSDN